MLLALLVLIAAGPASKPRIAPAAAVYFSGPALDVAITEYGLARGLREGNPLMRHRGVRIGHTLAIGAAFTYVDLRLQRGGRNTKPLRVAYIVAHVAIIGWNVHKIRGAR